MKLTPVGIDIAKYVFQVHYVDEETGEIVNKPITIVVKSHSSRTPKST
jgi:hypothetical protein